MVIVLAVIIVIIGLCTVLSRQYVMDTKVVIAKIIVDMNSMSRKK